jgi:diguanylate cyclase (GGDEF)-like protein
MKESMSGSDTGPPPNALILVVDDDRMMRTFARDALEGVGLRVDEAADGSAAIARFEELGPSLVMLDVHMPGIDGYEVCRELRRLHPGAPTPILMVTSADDRESIERAYEVGATDFISKPINWDLLGHRVRYLLRASRTLEELRRSEDLLAKSQRLARLGSWEWNPETGEMRWSEETFRVFSLDPGAHPPDYDLFLHCVHPEDRGAVQEALAEAERSGKQFSFEHRLLCSGGTTLFVQQQGEAARSGRRNELWVGGTIQDVTEQARAQARIRYLANYDSLTGLPNRRLFREQLERAIRAAEARGHLVGLLFMDLDRFKLVNDSLGHSAGDELLKTVSERFRAHIRGSDVVSRVEPPDPVPEVSRLGGDEFTVLLSKISQPQDALDVARRILDSSRAPITVDGKELTMGVSIGIAVYPLDGRDAETIMKNADAAMYHAKELGGNSLQFFSPAINAEAMRNLTLECRLREALDRQELRLHYQPRIELGSRRITGVEALLRWKHPELGIVRPGEFIPLSEETGLIRPIGEWVLHTACAQNRAWQEAGYERVCVSVNVSSRQFEHFDLMSLVRRALQETGLAPSNLELELTESVLMEDAQGTARVLRELQEMGVHIALDDFGTGFSSLSYLRSLPLDVIKIDRCFVAGIPTEPRATGIATAVITLAHGLGLTVVAEGVESEEQAAFLEKAGCDEMQGFLFTRALPPDELAGLLPRQKDRRRR